VRLKRARREPPSDIGPALGFLGPAAAEARALGHNYIGTEHLLLALLAQPSSPAAVALGRLGIAADDARDRLLGKLAKPPLPRLDPHALGAMLGPYPAGAR
jgi:ATP-dependent Clp protease ATP-binding subunit ClpA